MNLDAKTLEPLAAAFRGELILPDSSGYDDAREIYNAMIDRRPAVIARCTDVADVIAAVDFGREHGLDTAVRGGGHNGPTTRPTPSAWPPSAGSSGPPAWAA